MIFPKYILKVFIFIIILPSTVSSQTPNKTELERMLLNAREIMHVNHENCKRLSENIYQYALKARNHEAAAYSLLFAIKSNYYQRNYDFVLKNLPELKTIAADYNNFEILCEVHLIKAITINHLGDYNGAIAEIQAAKNMIEHMPNPNSRAIYQGLIDQHTALVYYNNNYDREVVLRHMKLSLQDFSKVQNPPKNAFVMYPKSDLLAASYVFIANEYVALQLKDSAKYYLAKSLATETRYQNPRQKVLTYNNLAYLNYLEKNYTEALEFYSKSEVIAKTSDDPILIRGAYDGLSIVHRTMGNFKEATHYMHLKSRLDENYRITNQKSVANSLDNIFDEKNKVIMNKNEQLSNLQIALGIGLLIGTLALILLYKEFKKQKNTKKQLQFLVNQKLNKSLSKKGGKPMDLEKLVELAVNNDPAFYPKFREANRDFISKLIQTAPNINVSELKLAAYLKLDFSAKEIAQATKTTVRSVEAKKYRLRKKLDIPTDQDIHLWLAQF